ncbi:MAG: Xaa-Pro peptidase family protein [Candidatus Omnitrophota bacterium]
MPHREKYIEKVRAKISGAGMDALLVSGESDIRYLTGYYSHGGLLLIPVKGEACYFVDGMNAAFAENVLGRTGVAVKKACGPVTAAFAEYANDIKLRSAGFDSGDMSVAVYGCLKKLLPKTRFIPETKACPVNGIVGKIREIKDEAEIKALRKAAKETVSIWREVKKGIRTGMSEMEIAVMLDVSVRRRGYENSFETIAAIGENTAYPHAIPSSRRLASGEHVLVDFGIKLDGYCSDLTRIYCNGRMNGQIRGFRGSVRRAHDLAIAKIKPAVTIGSVASAADSILKKDSFGEFILHGLGHGVGRDVHEGPLVRKGSAEKFRAGMVVTVEPGLYKPGLGGIRLEDMVVVTKTGCEVLTI